jgi:FtsH-binding integral membrane protein
MAATRSDAEDNVYNNYSPERLGVRPAVQLSNRFLIDAFIWMFGALILSGVVAYWVANAGADTVVNIVNLRFPLFIAQLGLGLGLQMGIRKINASLALALFFVYAGLMGLTIGVWVWYYADYSGNAGAVYEAFFSAAAAFGGAAIYGAVTRRSLASVGGYLFMGAWGLFFAFLINGFIFHSSGFDLVLSVVGVVIFTALAAWTTQRISNGEFAAMTGSMEKASVLGAILLYIEFINIFLMMLRIFGGGGRR